MNKAKFEKMLRNGQLQVLPMDIRVAMSGRGDGYDAVLDITWQGQSCRYVAELKADARPQTLELAINQVKRYAAESGLGKPMVIVPYLTEEKLSQLLNEGVSAMDFCGNAAIEAPGQFYFWKTGNPNRYPDSAPIRSAYRGDSSLVARVLLLEPEFNAVGEILEAIKRRGGSLTMGTVSKVLKQLESDLVIERQSTKSIRLIQPERVLNQLLEAYQLPKIESTWLGKLAMSDTKLQARLQEIGQDDDVVRTGDGSAAQYGVYAGEPVISCYCRKDPAELISQLGADASETRIFPNLRLMQTSDQRVYFDPRPKLTASPIQAWLEMASGDKRQKDIAVDIRKLLLETIGTTS